ncbi:fumarylacetoacetate hydrolase family protein [Mycobacterium sp.]|uniref:fumarylacetoacetate hydrolase family protein n=1 Tax=Mycobacterium sp. TaxID=1785 RepID=UPI002D1C46A5|nr:fumarylacetoacetate hydrolase family protein [Mycobacterium sp.]HKP43333.1 fumarylacetoacetate hydrolase family protein [Mycobacterium sp.]
MSARFLPLPFGVFSVGAERPRVGVAIGDRVLDLAAALGDPVFDHPSLNPFLARGPNAWSATREALLDMLDAGGPGVRAGLHRHLFAIDKVRLHLPFEVADFVDFFSSIEHAVNAGRILRPGEEPLKPNWRHLPVGYHGRAGTVVASGTPIRRPRGQYKAAGSGALCFAPTAKLDVEVELGFVVGTGSPLGTSVTVDEFEQYVFGMVLLLDWSARDIQAWEYVPLGPFLGKSFATTISPWVIPLESLAAAKIAPAPQDPPALPHLSGTAPFSYDIALELRLNGHLVSTPSFASMYWPPAQQLAHMTSNGASLRTGDLYGTGTISSYDKSGHGSFMELTSNGNDPLTLPGGEQRGFLEDHDVVAVSATAPAPDGGRFDLAQVSGCVVPALVPANVQEPVVETTLPT